MLKAGVTGGIGSGKSIVCQVFNTLGIPVFNADDAARHLMENDPDIIQGVRSLLGDVYIEGRLNREKISAAIFRDQGKLQQLNGLVHPATISYADEWMKKQVTPYIIKEAAIFFESGSYKEMDVMIGVYAPQEIRIKRTMDRNAISRGQVLTIMAVQMNEDEKMKRCDHVITNDDLTAVLPQVLKLHEALLQTSRSKD